MDAHPQPRRPLRRDSIAVQWRQAVSPHRATAAVPRPAVAPPPLWPAPEIIIQHVAGVYDRTPALLRSTRRDPDTVEARRLTMHLLAAAGCRVSAIGRLLGRDHSTVIHHLRHVTLNELEQEMLGELTEDVRLLAAPTSPLPVRRR